MLSQSFILSPRIGHAYNIGYGASGAGCGSHQGAALPGEHAVSWVIGHRRQVGMGRHSRVHSTGDGLPAQ
jgi:hypothetical protein